MILGIDPGGTTGACLLDIDNAVAFIGLELQSSAFMSFVRTFCEEASAQPRKLSVACERFTISQETTKKTRQHDALDVIGVLRGLCEWHMYDFSLQERSAAKRLVRNPQLRIMGTFSKGREHANDAARHAWLYVARASSQRFLDAREGGYVLETQVDDDGTLMMRYLDGLR